MSVYKRSDGIWFIRVLVSGKYFQCYSLPGSKKCFRKKMDALAYEPIFYASVLGSKNKKPLKIDALLIDDFFHSVQKTIKPSTYYGYVQTFNLHWKPLFSGLMVSEIDNKLLEFLTNKALKGKKGLSRIVSVGKAFVRYLKKYNPALDYDVIKAPKSYKPKMVSYKIYSLQEFELFSSVIDDERDLFLFRLLFFYGLRISEALGLKWSDFKEDGLHIERIALVKNVTGKTLFTSPKTTNSYRVYPILKIFVPYIQKEKLRGDSDRFVFAGLKGSSVMGQTTARRINIEYAKSAGLPAIKLHEFRHSCVSNLLKNKMPVRLVARWVGDTESIISSTYSHLLPNEKDEIAKFINCLS